MSANLRNSYTKCQEITKSNSTEYDPPLRGLYVGTSGNVAVVLSGTGETAVTIPTLAAGVIHELSVTKVMSTNTVPTDIIGFN